MKSPIFVFSLISFTVVVAAAAALAGPSGSFSVTPTTAKISADLAVIQRLVIDGKVSEAYQTISQVLPELDVDATARARVFSFLSRLLDSRKPFVISTSKDLADVAVIFYNDWMDEKVIPSVGVFQAGVDATPWTDVDLRRESAISQVKERYRHRMGPQGPGVWISRQPSVNGLYMLEIARGVGKDAKVLRLPVVVAGVEDFPPPPKMNTRWIDDKHLEIKVEAESAPSNESIVGQEETEVLLVNREQTKPIWSALLKPKGGTSVVAVNRSDIGQVVLYSTRRRTYYLPPVKVLTESRRIVRGEAFSNR